MCPVWTPQKAPPHPRDISGLSPDAEVVLHALYTNHKKREDAAQRRRDTYVPEAATYYKSIYMQGFGSPMPDIQQKTDSQLNHTYNMSQPTSCKPVKFTQSQEVEAVNLAPLTQPVILSQTSLNEIHTSQSALPKLPQKDQQNPPREGTYFNQTHLPRLSPGNMHVSNMMQMGTCADPVHRDRSRELGVDLIGTPETCSTPLWCYTQTPNNNPHYIQPSSLCSQASQCFSNAASSPWSYSNILKTPQTDKRAKCIHDDTLYLDDNGVRMNQVKSENVACKTRGHQANYKEAASEFQNRHVLGLESIEPLSYVEGHQSVTDSCSTTYFSDDRISESFRMTPQQTSQDMQLFDVSLSTSQEHTFSGLAQGSPPLDLSDAEVNGEETNDTSILLSPEHCHSIYIRKVDSNDHNFFMKNCKAAVNDSKCNTKCEIFINDGQSDSIQKCHETDTCKTRDAEPDSTLVGQTDHSIRKAGTLDKYVTRLGCSFEPRKKIEHDPEGQAPRKVNYRKRSLVHKSGSTSPETNFHDQKDSGQESSPSRVKHMKVKSCKSQLPAQSPADIDLQCLESIIDQPKVDGPKSTKSMKRTSFATPFKKSKCFTKSMQALHASREQCTTQETKEQPKKPSRLKRVADLSDESRDDISQLLWECEEVALTLVYSDGSSQLRELVPEGVTAIAVAYPIPTASGPAIKAKGGQAKRTISLHFIEIALNNKQEKIYKWTKNMISSLMKSKTRKLCFDAQELMQTLLVHFKFSFDEVCSHWLALDPKVASWLLDPEDPPVTFGHVLKRTNDIQLTASKDIDDQICDDLSLLGPVMVRLYRVLKDQDLWELFTKLEMPLCPLLAVMETRGLKINTETLLESCDILKKKLHRLEAEAYKAAGHPFLINSHPQLRQILFEELKLDQKLPESARIARTSVSQKKSTSESVLTQLENLHPLPKLMLEYRQIQKLKSTYVDGMLSCLKSGYLYTHWDHTAAVTGRLTSANPNIQAIPKQPVTLTGVNPNYIVGKDDVPVDIYARDPFVSHEGHSLLAADFSQIELRILAHLTEDPALLGVFTDSVDLDIFTELTSQWLEKTRDSVSNFEREQTKRIVYSVMYGAGKDRLAEYLKISTDQAKAIMNSFLKKFPCINAFTKRCIEKARQQGSAADLCKAAMIQVQQALDQHKLSEARLMVQIHDELLLEVADAALPQTAALVKSVMESATSLCGNMVHLQVPLQVALSVGKKWGHLQDYSP